ncbi:MAG: hypothetical protein V4754_18805 [Pseudomonadota bacterium]
MQITSSEIKKFIIFSFSSIIFNLAFAHPTAGEEKIKAYRDEYKNAASIPKYILVDAAGRELDESNSHKGIYLLDISKNGSSPFLFSKEINQLKENHFLIEIDNATLIEGKGKDFLILKMSRPSEYSNDRNAGCAGGMGEDKAVLISISNQKVFTLNNNLLGCGDEIETIKAGGSIGYKITVNRNGYDKAYILKYILSDDNLIPRKEKLVKKEE